MESEIVKHLLIYTWTRSLKIAINN